MGKRGVWGGKGGKWGERMETRRARLSARKSLLNGPFHGTAFSSRRLGVLPGLKRGNGDFARDDGLREARRYGKNENNFRSSSIILFQTIFAVRTSQEINDQYVSIIV